MTDTNRRIAELLEPEPKRNWLQEDRAWRPRARQGPGPKEGWLAHDGLWYEPRNFSGSWADAGWPLEEMARRGLDVDVYLSTNNGKLFGLADIKRNYVRLALEKRDTGPAAIAQAALKALEDEHDPR